MNITGTKLSKIGYRGQIQIHFNAISFFVLIVITLTNSQILFLAFNILLQLIYQSLTGASSDRKAPQSRVRNKDWWMSVNL